MTARGLVNEIVIGSVALIVVGLLLGTIIYKIGYGKQLYQVKS